jgi:hypothetical protein
MWMWVLQVFNVTETVTIQVCAWVGEDQEVRMLVLTWG